MSERKGIIFPLQFMGNFIPCDRIKEVGFLVSDLGRLLEVAAVRRTLYELSRWTGLGQGAVNRGPRLLDFRHRFASKP